MLPVGMGKPFDASCTLAQAVERAPGLVFVFDADGAVQFANPAAESVDLPALVRELRDAAGGVRDVCVGRSWWSLRSSPLPDGNVLVIGADITERKAVEAQLRRSEGLLIDAQGVAHLGTWEWDVTRPTAAWSPELYKIYDLRQDEYVPSYEAYLQKVHPDDRERVKTATERVFKEHEPYSHDERILRPDGSIRYLHTWAYPVLVDGKLVRLVGVCQDVTERRLVELALEDRAKQLALTNERLQAEIAERERVERQLRQAHKLEAIGRLARGIAHDFNNLLGVITLRSSVLSRKAGRSSDGDPALVAEVEDSVAEILAAARHASRLTQQLLTFSRDTHSSFERVDLRLVVRDVSEMLARTLGENIDLVCRVEDDAPFVAGDRAQLDQVFLNLVINARDAMTDGRGGRIDVEVLPSSRLGEPPPLDLDPAGDYVVVRVTDTGVGMDDAIQARIFDPYFTTKESGNGLGLSTVYGIVRQCGGAIAVTSSPNRGARLTLFFPRATEAAVEGHADAKAAPVSGATILLVEDQEDVRRLAQLVLEQLGYDVFAAEGSDEALAIAEREHSRIDLLLTDILMPRMNGVELARRIVALVPEVRVLYMSGWAHASVVTEIPDSALLLHKPFTAEQLASAIAATLEESQTPRAAARPTPP
jgi:two-component system, cell cycle sensor histidine kinase and response regulator CckA